MAGGSRRVGSEPIFQLSEGLAAMADRCFFSTIDFRQRTGVRWIKEDRVVTEAMGAARIRCDPALDDAGGFEENPAVERDGDVRDESCGTRGPLLIRELAIDRRELH